MNGNEILKIAANALNEKKAIDIQALKIGDLTIIADYFLLATATSSTHVRALADSVEEMLEKSGVMSNRVEGRSTGWILIDYGDTIIHIFNKEAREFYRLDRLWNDGEPVDLTELLNAPQEA